ncbi:nucleotidyltransferase domain-containing protein [Massilia sp. DD77]|uniref:nucleotidyltransferase domain-containing protein n=1 Tax=Massilia sp. DD77 TaxID=3109349 RepID=UPI00300085E7
MENSYPETLPKPARAFIDNALQVLPADPRILALAAAGSYLTGNMDQFSDLDLIIVTEPQYQEEVLRDRLAIARKLGAYLAGFTGEHVGDSRVLITLYDSPLLHVDLKFVSLVDAHVRVEEPALLWQRDERASAALTHGLGPYPQPNIHWIDDRFWIWIHYGASKIGRGEIFEAIDMINYIRSTVLGPLALRRVGARPQGVRRMELADPDFAMALQKTIPTYSKGDCLRALRVSATLYQQLRKDFPNLVRNLDVEQAVFAHMEEIEDLV